MSHNSGVTKFEGDLFCLQCGGLLAINSDAHTTDGLNNVRYGIAQARRAWANADEVINTRKLEEFLSYIGGGVRGGRGGVEFKACFAMG